MRLPSLFGTPAAVLWTFCWCSHCRHYSHQGSTTAAAATAAAATAAAVAVAPHCAFLITTHNHRHHQKNLNHSPYFYHYYYDRHHVALFTRRPRNRTLIRQFSSVFSSNHPPPPYRHPHQQAQHHQHSTDDGSTASGSQQTLHSLLLAATQQSNHPNVQFSSYSSDNSNNNNNDDNIDDNNNVNNNNNITISAWLSTASNTNYSSSNNNNNDTINNSNWTIPDDSVITVREILPASLDFLLQQQPEQNGVVEEPVASVTHLLAHVLDLPWETGYHDLQQLLTVLLLLSRQGQLPDNNNKSNDNSSAVSLSSSLSSLAQQTLSTTQLVHLKDLLQRRCKQEPIQYLVGQWDFLDYTFQIRPPLLCPRPETEQLVDLVWKDIIHNNMMMITTRAAANAATTTNATSVQQPYDAQKTRTTTRTTTTTRHKDNSVLRILDVGCGTGCIGISLAAMAAAAAAAATGYNSNNNNAPKVHVTAIDIDPVAVETSRENAKRILKDKHEELYQVHLAAAEDYMPSTNDNDNDEGPFDIVVSNPPYIPDADWDTLHPNVRNYESRQALTAGADGMNVIRSIVYQLGTTANWSKPDDDDDDGSGSTICWMEVDPSQPALLQDWLEKTPELRVEFVSTHRDFYGRQRFVKLRVRSSG